MLIVHVLVNVKSDKVEAFKAATIENSKNSIHEAGIARFDVLQQLDEPTNFLLVEIYKSEDAPARHKETAHYKKWKETVEPMMAQPRKSIRYTNIFP